jgi:signal transduction histidine kinase
MAPGSSEGRAELRDSAPLDLALVLHDVRQPLSAVFALAEVARGRPDVPADVRDLLTQVIEEAQEVSAVLDSALVASGAGAGVVDVDELLSSVVDSFRRTWSGTVLRSGSGGAIEVRGGRAQVRRCLVNVVDNAARAAGPDGTVTVTVERGDEGVRILVDDDGPGFGRVPGRTGIGLAATRQALHRMGGALSTDLVSRHGGACVCVALPVRPHGPDPVLPSARAV